MGTHTIPDDIRRYLLQCVPSVPYIEAVLLMRDNRQAWSPEGLAKRLYLRVDETARLLGKLELDGLVARQTPEPSGYVYAPGSPELKQLWDRLAVVYLEHLIEISNLIHTKPSGKAQIFADAFVWRKEK